VTDAEAREKLARLGPDRLADALLGLAARHEEAALVETLLATPEENVRRFRHLLAGLKRRRKFVPRHEASAFAAELTGVLGALEEGVKDPRAGLELVADFCRCDQAVFEHCDDSDGAIGDVFRCDARDAFVRYAAACEDKRWVADLVFDLHVNDDYGARTEIVAHAAEFLPEEAIQDHVQSARVLPVHFTPAATPHHSGLCANSPLSLRPRGQDRIPAVGYRLTAETRRSQRNLGVNIHSVWGLDSSPERIFSVSSAPRRRTTPMSFALRESGNP